MRALKIIGGIVAAFIVLVVAGGIALVLWVDPNDYRDDIAKLVEQRTGRELRIGGELDLKLFPWLAIEVNDVALGNPPGFGSQPFLTVERASVGVKLLPLLRQRLEVSRVAVEGLDVTLVSRGEESNNWKDLAESKEEPGAENGGGETSIAGIDVTRSTLVYRDEAEDSIMRLSGLEAHTGRVGGAEPVPASLKFAFDQGERAPLARLAIEMQAHLPAGGSRVELRDVQAAGQWFGAPEEGNPGENPAGEREPLPITVQSPALVVDLDAETLAPATLDVRLGELPLEITVSGERLFTDRVVAGKLTVPQASPRSFLPSLGVELPVTSDPKVLSRFELASGYRLTETQLRLDSLDMRLDDTRIRGTAGIDDLESTALRFALEVDAIDVDRYLEPEKETKQPQQAQNRSQVEEEPTEIPAEALRELDAKGTLRIGRAKLAGLAFSDVRLPLAAAGGLVRLGPTQAGLFGGAYTGNVVLDARPARPRLSLDEHARGIDIGALMKAVLDTDRISGRGDASAVLDGTGRTDAEILDSLAGRIEADVRDGALNGIDLLYELRRARALLKRTAPPERTGPPRTTFNTFAGSAKLADGVMRNDDLRIETDLLRARGQGTLDITTQQVDYRLVAEIYKLPPEGEGAELTDLKAAEIPVSITGTLEDMKIRPDLGSLVQERVRKEVDQQVEKKKEELRKKLDDKLKDLLGR